MRATRRSEYQVREQRQASWLREDRAHFGAVRTAQVERTEYPEMNHRASRKKTGWHPAG